MQWIDNPAAPCLSIERTRQPAACAPIDTRPRNTDRFTQHLNRTTIRAKRPLEGRCTVRQGHIQRTRRFAGLAASAGVVILLLPPANAAEANGAGDTVLVAAPPAGIDKNGLREPSTGGPLVLRGTRPEIPKLERATAADAIPPAPSADTTYGFSANLGFQPGLAGNGWNAQYDYRGFDLPVTPR
ncbi:MAG: hypothetical protein JO058_15355 [Alphaproteobacteria bacterium]|nr:hypothetical protein [Alphaproteobacteria bacterium]